MKDTSNHLEPGAGPLLVDLGGGLRGAKTSVGAMDNNCWIIDRLGEPAVIVDPAAEGERLLELLGEREVAAIVVTHRHHDHVGALAKVASATGAPVFAGTPDCEAIAEQTGVHPAGVWDGEVIGVSGGGCLDVIGLVGHTPGSITLAWTPADAPAHLFTGDSLFPGGPGRTSTPQDFTSLIDDLASKIFDVFSDDTRVHPGHGDDTTLEAEHPHLPTWRSRGW